MAFLMGTRGLVEKPFDVTVDDFDLPFIARGLSRLGRYLGSGSHFYSVAEHSVELSNRVAPEHAKAALLHDASECFVGDLHSEIKAHLLSNNEESYFYLERFFWELVAEKFDLPIDLPPAVHALDKTFRALEMQSLFETGPFRLRGADPRFAECLFLERAAELGISS